MSKLRGLGGQTYRQTKRGKTLLVNCARILFCKTLVLFYSFFNIRQTRTAGIAMNWYVVQQNTDFVHLLNLYNVTPIHINTSNPTLGSIKKGPTCGASLGLTSGRFKNISKNKKSNNPQALRNRSYIFSTMKERQHIIIFIILRYLLCG